MTTYFNDVNEWLTVGGDLDLARDLTGQTPEATIAQLVAHGVTHVLDLRSEWNDWPEWEKAGLEPSRFRHAPIIDSARHTPAESWCQEVEGFVSQFLGDVDAGRLYVHCHMGVNRSPSASMLALLTEDPLMDPFEAFLKIREARSIAGLVYAEAIGRRHFAAFGDQDAARLFAHKMRTYWTPAKRDAVHRGIAYYRGREGNTVTVSV